MINHTKTALRAANRPPHRITTLFGHRVRVYWWHDVIMGLGMALVALIAMTLALAIL